MQVRPIMKGALGAGILAVLAMSSAMPAGAQWERPAGREPYMQFQGVACPGGGTPICQLTFPPVPAGKRLVLQAVNASINFAPGGVRRTAVLVPGDLIFAFPARRISDPNLLIVNESTLAFFESGQTPVFQIVLSDGADAPLLTAVLTGYLVNLEQQ